MKIDFGEIVGNIVQQMIPTIAQAVVQQLGGNHQQAQAQSTQNTFGVTPAAQSATVPATNSMFGGAATTQPAQTQQITPEMIQALITPLAQIEPIKNALVQQMQAAGVNSLPEARPDQLPDLYNRFKEVERQAQAAGLLGGGAAQGGTPSII